MRQKLLLLFLATIALAACSEKPEAGKEVAVRVEGEHVILGEADKATFLKTAVVERDTGSVLRLPGRLVWNEDRTVRVYPPVGGRIMRILAQQGVAVKAGQPLAVMASPDFGVAQADAKKAQADLHLARQAFARNQELLEAGVVARKDWQQSQADLARAEAEADRATRHLAQLGGEGDGSYAVKSPLDGVVVERSLNPGQEVRPDQSGSSLFVITDPTRLWVQLDASEADLAALKKGEKFAMEVKQYPGERFEGTILQVADFVDPTSRMVKVRGEVANAERRLKGEMFVTALVQLPPTPALHVPSPAVFLVGDKRYVLIEEGPGRYRRQEVKAGAEREGWVDVFSGVQAGDKVVVEGNLHLIKYFKPAAAEPVKPVQ